MLEANFNNPILPGFYPDPSICRVGDDYWLVTSSFSYFPGVPVFHSLDLVNWEQVGHVLDRPSQLDLDGVGHSQGIFAPTIRYHQGLFFLITTLVGKQGNFLVTAKNPAGPWSDPYWLADAPGIDPSLYFNEDGRAWVTGTAESPVPGYWGDNEIWMRELDLRTMKLAGPRFGLWRGAAKQAHWPEAPHLYKIGGWFYLMIAEGGTEYNHAVTIARSRDLTGPYEGNPANPILTHRHLGKGAPIWNAGHADLVQTQAGEWWMVCLAARPYGGHFRNLGRETFLAPVIWEEEWPVVSPGTGKLEFRYPAPDVGDADAGGLTGENAFVGSGFDMALRPAANAAVESDGVADAAQVGSRVVTLSTRPSSCGGCAGRAGGCCGSAGRAGGSGNAGRTGASGNRIPDDGAMTAETSGIGYICDFDGFDTDRLAHAFNLLRTPREPWWTLTERPGFLRLRLRPSYLGEQVNPGFVGRRQQHMTFTTTTELEFNPDSEGQSAGLALLQSDLWHIRFAAVRVGGELLARLIRCENGVPVVVAEAELAQLAELGGNGLRLMMRIEAEDQELRFLCGLEESRLAVLAEGIDSRMLSTDVAGGFVGTYVGMFAEGVNPTGTTVADFDSFSYEGC